MEAALAPDLPPVPLAGRQPELAWLENWLAQPAAPAALFYGPPGVGKTYLARCFAAQAAEMDWRPLWASAARPQSVALAWLASLGGLPWPPAGELGPQLAAELAQRAELTQRADSPLLLVIDDLNAADAGLLAGLAQLITAAAAGAPWRVLGLARSAVYDEPDWLAWAEAQRAAGMAELQLAPLSEGDVLEWLADWSGLGRRVYTLTRSLYAASAGLPFSLLELLRHLFATGRLHGAGSSSWTLVDPYQPITLPELNDVLSQRLLRLGLPARSLLAAAAQAGPAFDAADLWQRLPPDPAALAELLHSGLLVEQAAPAGPGYAFAAPLWRDLVLEALA